MEKEKELGNKLANHLKVMELYQQQINTFALKDGLSNFHLKCRNELIEQFLDTQFEYNQSIMEDLSDIYMLLMGYQQ